MTTPPAPSESRSVVVVGHVCIDENSIDENGIGENSIGENSGIDTADGSPRALRRTAGSPAFFITRQLQHSPNTAVSVIAPYGEDFLELEAGIPLLNPARPGGTLLYRNHISGDIRQQECFHAGNAGPVALTPEYSDALRAADIVIVGPLLPNLRPDYLGGVLALTNPGTLTMLLVQGYLRSIGDDGAVGERMFAEYADVIPRFDVVVFSDEDLRDALAVAGRWSIEFPDTIVVVTRNRHGATAFQRGEAVHVPATPLERQGVGSVIGAGDVFSAALAVGYRESGDIRDSLARANALAASFIDGERVTSLAA